MTICKNEVNKATEKILKSCNTQGTRGAVHKYLLLTKIEGLRRLAVLYSSVSKKYENAAVKIAGGAPEYQLYKKEHKDFLMTTVGLCQRVIKRDNNIIDNLFEYLEQWLAEHIQGSDKKYTEFFNKNGII